MLDCMMAISSAVVAICSILLAFVGLKSLPKISKSLPRISEQIASISETILPARFNFCKDCPFKSVCVSPHMEDTGDFSKKSEIDNQDIADEIVKLYEEIKHYNFDKPEFTGSKEHQECLLKKLTIAINLIGSVNMSFNRLKDVNEVESQRADAT